MSKELEDKIKKDIFTAKWTDLQRHYALGSVYLLDGEVDPSWANASVEDVAKNWAIEHLASPHFDDVEAITSARVTKVRSAVKTKPDSKHQLEKQLEALYLA